MIIQRVYLIAIMLPLVYLFNRVIEILKMKCTTRTKNVLYVVIIFGAILFNAVLLINEESNFFIFIWNGMFIVMFPFMIWWNHLLDIKLNYDLNDYAVVESEIRFIQILKVITGIIFFLIPQFPFFIRFAITLSAVESIISNVIYKCIGLTYIYSYINSRRIKKNN